MGQFQSKPSKDELVYQQVRYGNAAGIRSLVREGAGLEWIDSEGKTPLILACMNLEHYNVAKTLIDFGANINAYRPGRMGGTPLHHAAKLGLEQTVKLLLSHGANALVMNDECQTPLEVARAKGYTNVVRAIEGHLCLFSGLLREFYGPGFLEILTPQFVTRKVWVVVLPTGSRNAREPFKLELAIYPSSQVAKPRTVISLWKANLEDPKLQQADPSITIVDNSNKTRIRLAAAKEGDRQQLQWFCDACKGIPQATQPPQFLRSSYPPAPQPQATTPLPVDDLELAMAMSASFQSDINVTPTLDVNASSEASASTSSNDFVKASTHGPMASPAQSASGASSSKSQGNIHNSNLPDVSPAPQASSSVPSAPPIGDEIVEDGPIQYPSIDFDPVDLPSAPMEESPVKSGEKKEDGASSVCVICLDAPVEGACVPCGHMAGCMSCLTEIKTKNWGCPVCRTKIDQIVRLYAV